ncbi:probable G-protein coupled receptor 142 [Callorhinchus milii]|uniref:probable G-protein coupled receptor 142 n=1 Tax=Callorhinchus milii TaxID=7868 RepID=UPI001C3FE88B|nr:probable G-protein coupled receptor 142 [Callorhinchus milii]
MEHPTLYTVIAIYYPILAAFGIPVNLLAIAVLLRGKCGLSKCITRYLVAMAAADLLVVLVDVLLNKINNLYFPLNILFYTPVCSTRIVLLSVAMHSSLWFTVAFTFDRFVAICCQKLKPIYCTERMATVVILTTPRGTGITKSSFHILDTWKAFERLQRIVLPMFGFAFVCLFNALTVRHIMMANKVRKRLLGQRNAEKTIDPELENRRKSVILLFAISGSLILLWLTFVSYSFKWQLSNFNYTAIFANNMRYIVQETGIMLQRLSCCTNTCIYALTQTKFREELRKGIVYPFRIVAKFIKLW